MYEPSMSLAASRPPFRDTLQVVFATMGLSGVVIILLSWIGGELFLHPYLLWISLALMSIGTIGFSWREYHHTSEGIKNNGVWFSSLTNRGLWAWMLGIVLTGFYIFLYWFPEYLGFASEGDNSGLVGFFDPFSMWLNGSPASQWFVYGVFYTLAILLFGIKFIWKYRHNRYHVIRTISVMFFQLGFAFLIPIILARLNQPSWDLKNIWPLNYDFFYEWNIEKLLNHDTVGLIMLIWGVALILIITPVFTYFYGKRWYCSWVCGCGGLAETAGDPFRHLSDKSLRAWRVERWMVHGVLVFVIITTGLVLYTYFSGNSTIFGINSFNLRSWYGFLIGAIFSGVIGVGFYPLMGNRVWCRFGCPMAAILGLQQRFFSKFRITTNGGQCISCGNCSTYCEMGIDVRWYAQRGQNIVRASCVGCGICAAVCPRGVLRLENGSSDINKRTVELKAFTIPSEKVEKVS